MSPLDSPLSHRITGLILAGGRATRMGGVDKGLQAFRGNPLVSHVLEGLAPQVGTILISANRNLGTYAALGYPVVTDEAPDLGPLGGVVAGLRRCETEYLLSAPCDCPYLPGNLRARLGKALVEHAADAAIVKTEARLEPLFCLMRVEVLPRIEAYLRGGGRKADGWYAGSGVVEVPFDDRPGAFANFNTLDDLAAAVLGEP